MTDVGMYIEPTGYRNLHIVYMVMWFCKYVFVYAISLSKWHHLDDVNCVA